MKNYRNDAYYMIDKSNYCQVGDVCQGPEYYGSTETQNGIGTVMGIIVISLIYIIISISAASMVGITLVSLGSNYWPIENGLFWVITGLVVIFQLAIIFFIQKFDLYYSMDIVACVSAIISIILVFVIYMILEYFEIDTIALIGKHYYNENKLIYTKISQIFNLEKDYIITSIGKHYYIFLKPILEGCLLGNILNAVFTAFSR